MSGQPVVQVENLDVYYGTSQILFGVGLSVRQGETMALLGRNGAGKSTTMKAIMGLAPARRGRVTLGGRVVSGLKPHHIARAGLGFVPEPAPEDVRALVAARETARASKDFAASDDLRDRIAELGWVVQDTPRGSVLVPK